RNTAPFRQGVKKTAQLGTGPREPKSVAKLQQASDTAKYFQEKIQEKRKFNIFSQLKDIFAPNLG
ncbi:MAG: hypothetical protein IJP59_05060, partial [Muribaculaceae bacterium]|nr:hypothetical protein [Muribaculaceae bacterium]